MNSNNIHKKGEGEEIKGECSLSCHCQDDERMGLWWQITHQCWRKKKIQFGYTWRSPIMCSNPFLLKASHVHFVTEIYLFFLLHTSKRFSFGVLHLCMDGNFNWNYRTSNSVSKRKQIRTSYSPRKRCYCCCCYCTVIYKITCMQRFNDDTVKVSYNFINIMLADKS